MDLFFLIISRQFMFNSTISVLMKISIEFGSMVKCESCYVNRKGYCIYLFPIPTIAFLIGIPLLPRQYVTFKYSLLVRLCATIPIQSIHQGLWGSLGICCPVQKVSLTSPSRFSAHTLHLLITLFTSFQVMSLKPKSNGHVSMA